MPRQLRQPVQPLPRLFSRARLFPQRVALELNSLRFLRVRFGELSR